MNNKGMITISRRNIIPEKYRGIHDFIFEWHDILAQIIVEGSELGLDHAKIILDENTNISEFNNLEGEELWVWFKENSYNETIKELTQKQLYFAILTDLCHFIYEALTCSERGKLTVCFALLRKPFKDNLLLLEWLLSDPEDFLIKFSSGNSDNVAPDKIAVERKLEIIQIAEKKAGTGLEQYNHIYDLRYNKKKFFSYEPFWNRASHIVTSVKFYKTESESLNFVFSDADALEEQWNYIYTSLPILMYHTVEVAISLFNKIYDDVDELIGITRTERIKKFFLIVDLVLGLSESNSSRLEENCFIKGTTSG